MSDKTKIIVGTANLIWNHNAEAVTLVIPAAAPHRPEWWNADQEVLLMWHGDNLVMKPIYVCDYCKDEWIGDIEHPYCPQCGRCDYEEVRCG